MPNVSAVIFAARQLSPEKVRGKRILDVGSKDFNGSIRPLIESWDPKEYIGVDIQEGRGVDVVAKAEELVERFGVNSFDCVLSIEMLEHSKTWKDALFAMKSVCAPAGELILTTRSAGFPVHGFPHDFWRFTCDDLRSAFRDFEVIETASDTVEPGAFIAARKPRDWAPADITDQEVLSVILRRYVKEIPNGLEETPEFKALALKMKIRDTAERSYRAIGRGVSSVLGV